MKRTIFLIGIVILAAVSAYLFWTDFNLVLRFTQDFAGYNAPEFKKPETVSVGDGELSFLDVPTGFEISVVAKNLENPRVILFDPKGRMLVSETKAGRVSVLDPVKYLDKRVLIDGLQSPHGLDFYKDPKTGATYLYIAETHRVNRYPYDINTGKLISTAGLPAQAGENVVNLPVDGRHFTRTIAFGPNFRARQILEGTSVNTQIDTKLYVSVGSSCDVCEENTWKRAAILESDPEGTYTAEFAGGLRNSVFFTFHPATKEIWATEMGRDNLGDNLPPDEINIVKVAGPEHKFGARRYGWPFCYGNKIQDKKFSPDKWERIDVTNDCSQTESPIIEIPAHSAPLGLVFVPDSGSLVTTPEDGQASEGQRTSDVKNETSDVKTWPKEWGGDLLVAFHGSWNSSVPVGYKIVRYDLDKNGRVLSQEPVDFVSGWLGENKKEVYGRPVDLKFGPDGALYVSDDAAGVIYKIESII
ncbi:MAG: PQQ-dependent sugar dehydrogenase [Candidatus Yanofskybacteria bacterium]|nr:PQQ-dependent sugar dehydrogenase [Candidatus Yanofskybacteria bacterium]